MWSHVLVYWSGWGWVGSFRFAIRWSTLAHLGLKLRLITFRSYEHKNRTFPFFIVFLFKVLSHCQGWRWTTSNEPECSHKSWLVIFNVLIYNILLKLTFVYRRLDSLKSITDFMHTRFLDLFYNLIHISKRHTKLMFGRGCNLRPLVRTTIISYKVVINLFFNVLCFRVLNTNLFTNLFLFTFIRFI